MKAIILCAGKGTRLRPLTYENPKPLLKIKDMTILELILRELPEEITEVILVVNYMKEKIQDFVNNFSFDKKIICIQQNMEMTGTFGALHSAKEFIEEGERFLVLNSDDLIGKNDIMELLKYKRSFGVKKSIMPNYYKIIFENNLLQSFAAQSDMEKKEGTFIATGSYVLDENIFDFNTRSLKGGEIGIPQTIIDNISAYPINVVICNSWEPINTVEDLEKHNQ